VCRDISNRSTRSSQPQIIPQTNHIRPESTLINTPEVLRQISSSVPHPPMNRGNDRRVAVEIALELQMAMREFYQDLAYQFLHESPPLENNPNSAGLRHAACGLLLRFHGRDIYLEHHILSSLEVHPSVLETSALVSSGLIYMYNHDCKYHGQFCLGQRFETTYE
jgi:hypothetical protein